MYNDTHTVKVVIKTGKSKQLEIKDKKPKPMSGADMAKVVEWLAGEQKAFADTLVGYMSGKLAAIGNETSQKQVGYIKFAEPYYFPYRTPRDYVASQPGQSEDNQRWRNKGFTKSTVAGANTPVVLENFTDAFASHTNEILMYATMSIPQENLLRLFNYKTPVTSEDTSHSVKAALQHAYGEAAKEYVETFISDLNGGMVTDPRGWGINNRIRGFKKAATALSLSVAIQQPSAFVRAMAVVDPKYFTARARKGGFAEAKKYAGTAVIKEIGGFDTGTGRGAADWLTSVKPKGLKNKVKEVFAKDGQYRDDVMGWLPSKMDEVTWSYIWSAVKKEIAATTDHKPGTEEFLQAAGKRFDEVIELTQVYDSVISRSHIMRSKDSAAKMATSFMAESTVTYNILYDAIIHAKDKNFAGKIHPARASAAIISSIVFNAILKSIIYAARDDDEEQAYLEKYAEALVGSLIGQPIDRIPVVGKYMYFIAGDLSPLTMIPYARDVISILQGYDVERADMTLISSLINAIDAMDSEKLSEYAKWANLAGTIGNLLHVPAKNVLRDTEAIITTAMRLVGGDNAVSGRGIWRSIKAGVGTYSTTHEAIYDAILDGDKKKEARLRAHLKDQALTRFMKSNDNSPKNENQMETAAKNALNDIDAGVAAVLMKEDPRIAKAFDLKERADWTALMSVYNELKAAGFTQDTITRAIKLHEKAVTPKEDKEPGKDTGISMFDTENLMTAISNAAAGGGAASVAKIRDELIAHSKAKDPAGEVKSSVTSEFKPKYIQYIRSGNEISAQRLARVLTDNFGHADEEMRGWVMTGYSDDMKAALAGGDPWEANEYIAELKEMGRDPQGIKQSITTIYKAQVFAFLDAGDMASVDELAARLEQLALYDDKGNPFYSWTKIYGEWKKEYDEKKYAQ